MLKTLLSSLLLLLGCNTLAANFSEPLPVEQAFQLNAKHVVESHHTGTVLLHWKIASGAYLYRDKFRFKIVGHPHLIIKQIQMPNTAFKKTIPSVGTYSVYQRELRLRIPVQGDIAQPFKLRVRYQGCTDTGVCYPPVTETLPVAFDLSAHSSSIEGLLSQGKPIGHLFVLFGFGLLMALTPCVLPMLPILLAVIMGQGNVSRYRRFQLALSYVLGMSLAYVGVGVLFASVGHYLQVWMQTPLVLLVFGVLLVLLALSLFDVFHLKLPQKWIDRIARITHQEGKGSYWGVGALGALSILILSPCTTPALVGVLTYMTQTGSFVFGGLGLFVMGLGAGMPLLLMSVFGAECFPKSGRWLNGIKYSLGVILLVLAVLLVDRAYPKLFDSASQVVGRPVKTVESLPFVYVNTVDELQAVLNRKGNRGKRVMIDVYAEWCVTCLRMDRKVFSDPEVKQALSSYFLVRIDLTRFNKGNRGLLRLFRVVAPPTMLFLNANHREIKSARLIGEATAQELLQTLVDK